MPSPGNRSCPLATIQRGYWRICGPSRRATTTTLPSSCCSRQAATTAPISSMCSSPSRWASSSSRAAICSCATAMCGCAPPKARSRSMSFIGGSMTPSWTRSPSIPNSRLCIPGLLSAVRSGRVALANALGTGVADDKAMYCYVPRMIEFYLGEHAILNNVLTYMLRDPKQRQHVFNNLHNLVVKEVQGSGGYGMLIGQASTAEEREAYKLRILKNPDNFIAQPTLALSTAPTLIDGEIVPRHVDLRPFVLSGKDTSVIPGGLTRVALRKGSLVVNSSQGGGTKDTWILERRA